MREKPKLQCTRDYDMFELHPINRPQDEKPLLLASMKAHGFMPSSPIQCGPRNQRGKLPVIRGHHRLHYAKRLELPVWYIIDDSNTDIYELEGDSGSSWSLRDFLVSRARGGNVDCQKVLAFQKKHGITQGAAISLMGGESADSGNKAFGVKTGTFKVADDLSHANAVVDVVEHFRSCGIAFAAQSAFVAAISKSLRIPECDPKILKHRASQAAGIVMKRGTVDAYLGELEALYNHGARNRLALKFRAKEVGLQRKSTFGKSSK